ncbi:EAL domain-containing protein [Sphingomonas donggukensis]|uniref:EAL domain-containing protein n=1 Tax=Sphingomonas donggukensis TaxID=2949093 RepID=A0ABY4TSN2_9SPHN|nr:EAL domain-containing protein [Sphingomonas donggukensis]URW74830.1 EAL domain-containing protein [Sphingomonas donggukensis]
MLPPRPDARPSDGARAESRGGESRGGRRRSLAKIFGWATLAALVTGLLGLGQPVDDYMRMARNMARKQVPSGEIVVVGIDDRSVERLGTWPWSRDRHTALINRLKAAGARHIVFDIFFHSPGATKAEDRRFAAAIEKAGNVWLAAGTTYDRATGVLRPKTPRAEFSKHANIVSVAMNYSVMASVRQLPYAARYHGDVVPSMAAALAGADGAVGTTFPLDYAIDLKAIKTVSAADVIAKDIDMSVFAGKDVLIAVASRDIGDIYFVPGSGLVNGGYLNVLGAETLKRGRPINVGWFIPFIIALTLSAINLFAANIWIRRTALVLAVFGATVLPFFAETRHIFMDVMPALILIAVSAISGAWANFRRSYKARGNINAVSGLPNLNALRGETAAGDCVLVAARVRNFAEISSSLPSEGERSLVDQIAARLALGARGARIYQGDEGIFVWATSPEVAGPDQLDALHALFRSPALVNGRPIDLSVTFGTDTIADRDLANRIGAALVAADEAAAENLRWKAYDPAKLADAEWKLSLLGRLDAAIDSGEVWVAYQPQLDVASGRISGAEALVRWSHPEKGEVSPMEFVLAAEQGNRIDKLTEFVLSDAIKTAASFAARGETFDIAVNISARLLEKPGLIGTVRRLLDESRLPPERLTLEVTESAAMTSGRASIRTLEEIGSVGINVSIDDYGTGFSTLEYFKKIPATEVKIDKSFVNLLDRNASDRLMVRSTIELAHSLGRIVVAEGVETDEILAELVKLGCDRIQGYLIGRPMKVAQLVRLIADRTHAAAA